MADGSVMRSDQPTFEERDSLVPRGINSDGVFFLPRRRLLSNSLLGCRAEAQLRGMSAERTRGDEGEHDGRKDEMQGAGARERANRTGGPGATTRSGNP